MIKSKIVTNTVVDCSFCNEQDVELDWDGMPISGVYRVCMKCRRNEADLNNDGLGLVYRDVIHEVPVEPSFSLDDINTLQKELSSLFDDYKISDKGFIDFELELKNIFSKFKEGEL